ncbi:hypothetical protein QTO34_016714, partial [Cnephaeus nilssonii]
MMQTLSSHRRWQRELSVPPAQSATPATSSPAPRTSWPIVGIAKGSTAQPEARLMAGECSSSGGSLSRLCCSTKDASGVDCKRVQARLRDTPPQCMNVVHQASSHGKCDCGKCKCDKGWSGDACQYPTNCDLTKKKSNQMCKNSQDIICSNAGTCHCGRCKCDNSDGNGLVYGKFCECDDRECIDDETEEICGGHGKCYCGNCYCDAGWHGDKCEFQCDITPWESKRRCTSPDGKICSNRGTCVCGECSCHDVDPTGDWGDIHGDTCECDERDCRAVYDRYSDDFCSGHGQCNCGRCDCKVGWYGKKCEHPRSCPLSAEESIKKCQGSSDLPCSGRAGGTGGGTRGGRGSQLGQRDAELASSAAAQAQCLRHGCAVEQKGPLGQRAHVPPRTIKSGGAGCLSARLQAFQKPPPSRKLLKGLVHQRTGTQLPAIKSEA